VRLCVISGIQKTFAGHTKTDRGPHAARVSVFGPLWYRKFSTATAMVH